MTRFDLFMAVITGMVPLVIMLAIIARSIQGLANQSHHSQHFTNVYMRSSDDVEVESDQAPVQPKLYEVPVNDTKIPLHRPGAD
jgi:hypothetical protein